MLRYRGSILLLLSALLFVGCAPRVTVKPNPGPNTKGIRYYRPKPYLLLTPFEHAKTDSTEEGTTTTITGLSSEHVKINLEWLPDFAEEYAIQVQPGVGTVNSKVTLENGWNLTQIDTEIDYQLDELIEAIGSAAGELAPLAGAGIKSNETAEKPIVCLATNVPLGYYEAVLGRTPDGQKRLYGWRYVGFMPYAQCPVESTGLDCVPCQSMDLYGLVFHNGVMTFKPIHRIAPEAQGGYHKIEQQTMEGNMKTLFNPPMPPEQIGVGLGN